MPRTLEEDVHSSFVEFRAEENDKCISVQCMYCQQVRAKNTTRQRAHLLKCEAYLQSHPEVAESLQAENNDDDANGDTSAYPEGALAAVAAAAGHNGSSGHTTLGFTPNPRINNSANGTPLHVRPSLGADETPAKKQKTKHNSTFPEIPLKEVHAAFEEFKNKDDDKTMSARCLYCNQTRAKNTSRQREHLLQCPGYQTILKEKIPANLLRHQFDDDDVAASLAIPMPSIDLDFRLSINVKPKLNVGPSSFGRLTWVSCIGGRWAGRWGKGTVLPGGQDKQTTVSATQTSISARYLLQTNDEDPALISCDIKGWWNAEKDVMERLQDPVAADNVAASRYKLRVTVELETGDERYSDVNGRVYIGSGCRRGAEIVYDFYQVN